MNKIAVSACLAGVKCRYDGTSKYNGELMKTLGENYLPICPEMLGGRTQIPRVPCEILGGDGNDVVLGKASIVEKYGIDITEQMLNGAKKAVNICVKNGIKKVYLQHKSPTCGCGKIYDGTFSGHLVDGNGIFTALLIENSIEVVCVE